LQHNTSGFIIHVFMLHYWRVSTL